MKKAIFLSLCISTIGFSGCYQCYDTEEVRKSLEDIDEYYIYARKVQIVVGGNFNKMATGVGDLNRLMKANQVAVNNGLITHNHRVVGWTYRYDVEFTPKFNELILEDMGVQKGESGYQVKTLLVKAGSLRIKEFGEVVPAPTYWFYEKWSNDIEKCDYGNVDISLENFEFVPTAFNQLDILPRLSWQYKNYFNFKSLNEDDIMYGLEHGGGGTANSGKKRVFLRKKGEKYAPNKLGRIIFASEYDGEIEKDSRRIDRIHEEICERPARENIREALWHHTDALIPFDNTVKSVEIADVPILAVSVKLNGWLAKVKIDTRGVDSDTPYYTYCDYKILKESDGTWKAEQISEYVYGHHQGH